MMRSIRRLPILTGTLSALLLAGCAGTKGPGPTVTSQPAQQPQAYKVGKPYQINGVWYYPKVDYDYDETGIASWYGPGFHGQYTANGEVYDQNGLTAAHKTLPLPSMVRVTNLENGRSIEVRVNDRGPFSNGRIIDMTRRGAQLLGFIGPGTARVRVQVMKAESQAMAAAASSQGGDVGPKPTAAPSGIVTATPLPPVGGQQTANNQAPKPAQPAQNQVQPAPVQSQPIQTQPTQTQPAQNQPVTVAQAAPQPNSVLGTVTEPQPDGKVSMRPVHATNIFIQAGAFTQQANAQVLTSKLSQFGPARSTPVYVGNQLFYRVRLGPIANVDQADQMLQRVIQSGHPEARIVVD